MSNGFEFHNLPVLEFLLVFWEEKATKKLSRVDTAAVSTLGSRMEVWILIGSVRHLGVVEQSNASMLIGSMFPSAIAVATDGGISLISLVLGQGMKNAYLKNTFPKHPQYPTHTYSINVRHW